MSPYAIFPVELLQLNLTETELRVLVALYSFRGKNTDTVWPSLPVLAERAGVKDASRISKITKRLEIKGCLTKKKSGFKGNNRYTLTVPNLDDSAKALLPNLDESTNMDKATKPNLDESTKSNLDESTKLNKQTNEQTNEQTSDTFDQFWKAYPKKVGKDVAIKSWDKLDPDQILFEQIIANIKSRLASKEWELTRKPFIPNPSTYLNQARWKDESTITSNEYVEDWL